MSTKEFDRLDNLNGDLFKVCFFLWIIMGLTYVVMGYNLNVELEESWKAIGIPRL